MSKQTGVIITLPTPSPSEACDLELSALASRPEFQTEAMFGAPMPPEMLKRNEERRSAFRLARAQIIAKYGVFDEYLQPLLEDEQRLLAELNGVRHEIALIRARRRK